MTASPLHAAVFDLDDTLISEIDYQRSARQAVLQYLSVKTGIGIDEVVEHSDIASRKPRTEYFQTLLPRLGLPADDRFVSELIAVHREHLPDISWYPDVLASLEALRAAGVKLGIITDGYAVAQRQKLTAVKADQFFEAIVVSDELGRQYWKPHERPFRLVAQMLEVPLYEMAYVGDNPQKDFHVSTTLPITTVKMTRSDSLKGQLDYLDGVVEHHAVSTMGEIETLIGQRNGAVNHGT